MDPIRLGLVGVGWFGGTLADRVGETGLASVVACYARSPQARASFAEGHGCRAAESYEAMLGDDEIDGVILATPHSTHVEMIEEAAAAGKHVFVEKPLALTAADARRAIAAANAAGITLQVGFNRRRHPTNRRIKALIESGELGTLLLLEGNQSGPNAHLAEFPAWRADPVECPAGGMTAMGIHVVDTFHYFAGPAARVSAFSTRPNQWRELDEVTTVMIEYERGSLGTVATSYYVPAVQATAAYGTDASAWYEEDGKHMFLQRRGESYRSEEPTEPFDTLLDEMGEFARCISEGGVPETGGPEGLEAAVVLEAIVRSAAEGCAVETSELR